MNCYYSERSRRFFPGDEGLCVDEEFDRWLAEHDEKVFQDGADFGRYRGKREEIIRIVKLLKGEIFPKIEEK